MNEDAAMTGHSVKVKIVLLGDRAVGKSSIIRRFMHNHFEPNLEPTIGVDFVSRRLKFDDQLFKVELWDTAGQEKFRALIKGYLRGAHSCLFVYDISNAKTYESLITWIETLDEACSKRTIKIIVGNKLDLVPNIQAQRSIIEAVKAKSPVLDSCKHFEVSAKTGQNIEDIFTYLLEQRASSRKSLLLSSLSEAPQMPKSLKKIDVESRRKWALQLLTKMIHFAHLSKNWQEDIALKTLPQEIGCDSCQIV